MLESGAGCPTAYTAPGVKHYANQGTSSAQWHVVQDRTCHDGFKQKRTLAKPEPKTSGGLPWFSMAFVCVLKP